MSGFGINDKVLSSTPNTELLSSSGFGTTDKVISTQPIENNTLTDVGNSIMDKFDYINPGHWAGMLFNYADDLINKPEKNVIGENQKAFQNTFKTPETQEVKEALTRKGLIERY